MKKTVKVSINGVIFYVDEDGYAVLKAYLDRITKHFKNKEGGKEIIEDIEGRISELFQEKVSDLNQVISLENVKEVINVMGDFEEIIDDGENESAKDEDSTGKTYSDRTIRGEKKLYRDPESAILGGVTGGLGAYFNIDLVWMRLIFIILFFINGLGLFLYIILWIVLPAAVTTAQRLEMKGEDVTVSNIEKKIKEEYENVKNNIKNIKKTKGYSRFGEFVEEFFRAVGTFFKYLFKFIIGVIGFGFIIGGFAVLIAIIATLFFNVAPVPFVFEWDHHVSLPSVLSYFFEPGNISLFVMALLLTILLPLLSLIYGGAKLIFQFKANDKTLGVAVFMLWLLSAVILVFQIFIEAKNYRAHRNVVQSQVIDRYKGDIIYMKVDELAMENDRTKSWLIYSDDCRIAIDEENEEIYGMPEIDIEKSYSGYYEVELKKKAFGSNSKDARKNARELIYHWELKDSLLILDPYYTIQEGEKWRFPDLKITLKVPEGREVFLEESLVDYLDNVHNVSHTWDENMVDKRWVMKRNGLTLMEEK